MRKVFKSIITIILVLSIVSNGFDVEAAKISKKNINNLEGFIIGDLWNDCICNFSWYYEYRTDCCGNKMNPEKIRKKYNTSIKSAKKWNKIVTGLKEKKYKNLKKHWKVLYSEALNIQKILNETDFSEMKSNKTKYDFPSDKFNDYMGKISDDFYKLSGNYKNDKKISKNNISNLYNFVVADMWNDCICNFSHYYEDRLDACGDEMDPEKTRTKFNKTMKKAAKWNKVVKSLKGEQYKNLKKHWKVLYSEAKKIQKKVNKADFEKMKSNKKVYNLKADKFQKYMYKIMEDY